MVPLILPIALIAGAIFLHVRGERLLSVQSASMVPTFRPGDAVIIRPVPLSNLQAGEVIAYRSPHNRSIITHRLIRREPGSGRLITAGDAGRIPDQPVSQQLIIGRATTVAPRLGNLLDFFRRPLGLTIFIYIPATAVIAKELTRLNRGHPTYLVHWRYATKG